MFLLGLGGLNFNHKGFCYFVIDGYHVVFCNKLIRLSPYTLVFIAQQYYVKKATGLVPTEPS
jgi:hypothetical protein